jgi:hypothetical protein
MAMIPRDDAVVMCCFSGEDVMESMAIRIAISPPNSDEWQLLFARASEFCKRILPEIPINPEITDIAEAEDSKP